MSGDGKRGVGHRPQATAPILDSTEGETEGEAKPVRLCPCSSDVNLFSYGKGIVDFNAEIPDGALDLRMSQQQLHATEVAVRR